MALAEQTPTKLRPSNAQDLCIGLGLGAKGVPSRVVDSKVTEPPLYRSVDEQGSGTLYTARYRPVEGRVTYYWPGESWQQSFGDFSPGSRTVTLGRAS